MASGTGGSRRRSRTDPPLPWEFWHPWTRFSKQKTGVRRNCGILDPRVSREICGPRMPKLPRLKSSEGDVFDPMLPARRMTYAGEHFRSRLETLWAQAFDAAGLAWSYEPARFVLGGGTYLPDFW